MTLNLIKLCVGAESIEDLEIWIAGRLAAQKAAGLEPQNYHVTRMQPRRAEELLDGGSLYWVIKGNVQVRQRLTAIDPFTDDQGISRCRLVLEPILHPTRWQPRRPFQGWRYYKSSDAPADLVLGEGGDDLPADLQGELANLGLL